MNRADPLHWLAQRFTVSLAHKAHAVAWYATTARTESDPEIARDLRQSALQADLDRQDLYRRIVRTQSCRLARRDNVLTTLSAMVARFDSGDTEGAERCYREAIRLGATQTQIDAAWAQSKVV